MITTTHYDTTFLSVRWVKTCLQSGLYPELLGVLFTKRLEWQTKICKTKGINTQKGKTCCNQVTVDCLGTSLAKTNAHFSSGLTLFVWILFVKNRCKVRTIVQDKWCQCADVHCKCKFKQARFFWITGTYCFTVVQYLALWPHSKMVILGLNLPA